MNENEIENSLAVKENEAVLDFSNIHQNAKTEVQTFSNIKDSKKLFNLSNNVDYKLNDCVGEKIRVKEVLIRKYFKKLDTPEFDEETGEITKEYELKVSCVLIDDNGKSYATGSKTFTFSMLAYLGDFGGAIELDNGVDIEITKVTVSSSNNKALGFKLL